MSDIDKTIKLLEAFTNSGHSAAPEQVTHIGKQLITLLDNNSLSERPSESIDIVSCFNALLPYAVTGSQAQSMQDIIFQMLSSASQSEWDTLHTQFTIDQEKGIAGLLARAITEKEEETIHYTPCTLPKSARYQQLEQQMLARQQKNRDTFISNGIVA